MAVAGEAILPLEEMSKYEQQQSCLTTVHLSQWGKILLATHYQQQHLYLLSHLGGRLLQVAAKTIRHEGGVLCENIIHLKSNYCSSLDIMLLEQVVSLTPGKGNQLLESIIKRRLIAATAATITTTNVTR